MAGVRRARALAWALAAALSLAVYPSTVRADSDASVPVLEFVTPAPAVDTSAVPIVDFSPVSSLDSGEETTGDLNRVTFYNWYGQEISHVDVPAGHTVEAPEEEPEVSGFEFQFWFDEVDEEVEPFAFDEPVEENVNLIPHYEILPPENSVRVISDERVDDLIFGILGNGPMADEPGYAAENILIPAATEQPAGKSLLLIPEYDIPMGAPAQENAEIVPENILQNNAAVEPPAEEEPIVVNGLQVSSLITQILTTGGVTDTPQAIVNTTPQEEEPEPQPEPEDILLPQPEITATPVAPAPEPEITPTPEPEPPEEKAEEIVSIEETPEPEPEAPLSEATPGPEETIEPEWTPEPVVVAEEEEKDPFDDLYEMLAEQMLTNITPPGQEPSSQPTATATPEPTQEPEPTPEAREEGKPYVEVQYEHDGPLMVGSKITLRAVVHNPPENCEMHYQWQNDATGTYWDVSGATGETYTFVIDEENAKDVNWRVNVSVTSR